MLPCDIIRFYYHYGSKNFKKNKVKGLYKERLTSDLKLICLNFHSNCNIVIATRNSRILSSVNFVTKINGIDELAKMVVMVTGLW